MHMPVHGHSRPCQPDDVLTFSKNHLCVYKELPLLHNRSMHMPASAWIFGSKSIQVLYLLLRRHCRRALGPSLHLGGLSPNPLSCTLNNGDKYHRLCILIWLQRRMLSKRDVSAMLKRPLLKKIGEIYVLIAHFAFTVYFMVFHGLHSRSAIYAVLVTCW